MSHPPQSTSSFCVILVLLFIASECSGDQYRIVQFDDPVTPIVCGLHITSKSFQFQVKSSLPLLDVHILTSNISQPGRYSYRVSLVNEANIDTHGVMAGIYLYQRTDKPLTYSIDHSGSYQADTFTKYWIKWDTAGILSVGTGEIAGGKVLMEASTEHSSLPLNYILIDLEDTKSGTDTEFVIPKNPGDGFWVQRGEAWIDMDIPASNAGNIQFYVHSCNAAMVAIGNGEGMKYKIEFGNETDKNLVVKSGDDDGFTIVAQSASPVPSISCNDFREFNLEWSNSKITLMTALESAPLLSWEHNGVKIDSIGFLRGVGKMNKADFYIGDIKDLNPQFIKESPIVPQFAEDSGMDVQVSYNYPAIFQTPFTAVSMNHMQVVTLSISTVQNITIEVSLGGSNISESGVKFVLSKYQVMITNGDPGDTVAEDLTEPLFHDGSFTHFTLRWFEGSFILGLIGDSDEEMEFPGRSPIVTPPESPMKIHFNGMHEIHDQVQVDQLAMQEIRFVTSGEDVKLARASIYRHEHLVFRISPHVTTSQSGIYLCTQVEDCKNTKIYDIYLNNNGSAPSTINGTEERHRTAGTSGRDLDPGTMTTFWLRWDSLYIYVGVGADFTKNEFMRLKYYQPLHAPIWAAAFYSSDKTTWSLLKNGGNTLYLDHDTVGAFIVHKPANGLQFSTSCNEFGAKIENHALHPISDSAYEPDDILMQAMGLRDGNAPIVRLERLNYQGQVEQFEGSLSLRHPSNILKSRELWISLHDKGLHVGQGPPLSLTALAANPAKPQIDVMQEVMVNFDEKDKPQCSETPWEIPLVSAGRSIEIIGTEDSDVWNWIVAEDEPGISFIHETILSCMPIYVVVTSYRGLFDDSTYTVEWDTKNKRVSIYHGVDTTVTPLTTKTSDSPFIHKKCTMRQWYWISWDAGTLQAGFGPFLYEYPAVQWSRGFEHTIVGAAGFRQHPGKTNNIWIFTEKPAHIFDVQTYGEGRQPPELVIFHDTFGFRLRTCNAVNITLTPARELLNEDSYIIRLDPINESIIVKIGPKTGHETLMRRIDLTRSITCAEFTDFWISLDNRKIQLGKGSWHSKALISVDTPSESDNYRVVQLSSDAFAQWTINDNAALISRFYSNRDGRFDHFSYRNHGSFELLFRVQACRDVAISLDDATYKNMATFDIGRDDNTWNGIEVIDTLSGDSKEVSRTNKTDTLDCNIRRQFWASWADALKLGAGKTVNEHVLAEYSKPGETKHYFDMVYSLGVAALKSQDSKDQHALWEFSKIPDGAYIYESRNLPNRNHYVKLPALVTSYTFRLRTCYTGYVSLYDSGAKNLAFQLEFGKTSKLYSMTGGGKNDTYNRAITGCEEDVELTLSWGNYNRNLVVSRKGIFNNQEVILTGGNFQLPITEIQFGSDTWTDLYSHERTTAYWTLHPVPGKSFYFFKEGGLFEPQQYCCLWKMVELESWLILQVKGLKHANVVLSPIPGSTGHGSYEIQLANANSYIKFNNEQKTLYDWDDDITSIVSYHQFWASWLDGHIEVGSGRQIGQGRFMNWRNPNPGEVLGLVVYSEMQWRLDIPEVPSYVGYTPTDRAADEWGAVDGITLWMNQDGTTDHQIFKFSVEASDDARLVLSSKEKVHPDWQSDEAVEVRMGTEYSDTTSVEIRKGKGGDEIIAKNIHEGLISTESMTEVWISWAGENLTVGLGSVPGEKELLTTELPIPSVDSILLYSTWDDYESAYENTWKWPVQSVVAVEYPLMTHGVHRSIHHWRDVLSTHIIFQVKGCGDIIIALASEKLPDDALPEYIDATEIILQYSTHSPNLCDKDYPCVSFDISRTANCQGYMTYWIMWDEDFFDVTFGQGSTLNYNVIGTHMIGTPHPVTAVGVRNPSSYRLDFRFMDSSDLPSVNSAWVSSPHYVYVPIMMTKTEPNQPHVYYFNVKTCGPIEISFADEHTTDHTSYLYQLVVNNTSGLTFNMRGKEPFHPLKQNALELLNCNKFTQFWVMFSDEFQFGTISNARNHTLFDYAYEKSPDAMILSSFTGNAEATWSVQQTPGDRVQLAANTNPAHLGVAGLQRIEFDVMSCSPVKLLLSEVVLKESTSYELVITKETVTIKESIDGKIVEEFPGSDLLSCTEFRQYWAEWRISSSVENSTFTIGHHSQHSTLTMGLEGFKLAAVNTLSISTNSEKDYAYLRYPHMDVAPIALSLTFNSVMINGETKAYEPAMSEIGSVLYNDVAREVSVVLDDIIAQLNSTGASAGTYHSYQIVGISKGSIVANYVLNVAFPGPGKAQIDEDIQNYIQGQECTTADRCNLGNLTGIHVQPGKSGKSGMSGGDITGLVIGLSLAVVLVILLVHYKDTWIPVICGPKGADVRNLVKYDANHEEKDEDDNSIFDNSGKLTFEDLESKDMQPDV